MKKKFRRCTEKYPETFENYTEARTWCDKDPNCTAIAYITLIQGDSRYGLCRGKFEDSEYDQIYAKGSTSIKYRILAYIKGLIIE